MALVILCYVLKPQLLLISSYPFSVVTMIFHTNSYHAMLVEIRIARIFNTYGPRMNIDDGRVVSNFIAQAVR
jgi:nucleoside-diphosphate-sugar epimerase